MGSFYINTANTQTHSYQATIFQNTTAKDSALYFTNILNSGILKLATGNPQARISCTIEPFPLTNNYKEQGLTYSTVSYIIIAFVFIPGFIARYIVYER